MVSGLDLCYVYRSGATYLNGGLGSWWSRSWSIWSVRREEAWPSCQHYRYWLPRCSPTRRGTSPTPRLRGSSKGWDSSVSRTLSTAPQAPMVHMLFVGLCSYFSHYLVAKASYKTVRNWLVSPLWECRDRLVFMLMLKLSCFRPQCCFV